MTRQQKRQRQRQEAKGAGSSLPPFDPNKPFRTADGREVRDFRRTEDLIGGKKVEWRGWLKRRHDGGDELRYWFADGTHVYGAKDLRLVNITEEAPMPPKTGFDPGKPVRFKHPDDYKGEIVRVELLSGGNIRVFARNNILYQYIVVEDGSCPANPSYDVENYDPDAGAEPATSKFDPDKPFLTRDGRSVRGFERVTDPSVRRAWKGYVNGDTRHGVRIWGVDGKHTFGEANLDLINVAEVAPAPAADLPQDDLSAEARALLPDIREAMLAGLRRAANI